MAIFNAQVHLQLGWNTNTSILLVNTVPLGKMLSVSLFNSFLTVSSRLKGTFLISRLYNNAKLISCIPDVVDLCVLFIGLVIFSLI